MALKVKRSALALSLLLSLSIYDTADPKVVAVEACSQLTCLLVRVPRANLDQPEALEALASHLEKHLGSDQLHIGPNIA